MKLAKIFSFSQLFYDFFWLVPFNLCEDLTYRVTCIAFLCIHEKMFWNLEQFKCFALSLVDREWKKLLLWLKKPKNVSWDHHLQRKRDRSLVYNNGCILTMQVNGIARYVHVPSSQRQGFVIQELRNYKALTLWR